MSNTPSFNLADFPSELWGSIAIYLKSKTLFRFKLTGNIQVWGKICDPRAVKRVKIRMSENGPFLLPACLNELRGLNSLFLSWESYRSYTLTKVKVSHMPIQLQKLELKFVQPSPPNFFLSDLDGTVLSLKEYTPHLGELQLNIDLDHAHSQWAKSLPQSLASLKCVRWDSNEPLPSCLLHLCVDQFVDRSKEGEIMLPPGLVSLETELNSISLKIMRSNPPISLLRLTLYQSRGVAFNYSDSLELGPSIENLKLHCNFVCPLARPVLVSPWFPALKVLCVPYFIIPTWFTLPESLTELEWYRLPICHSDADLQAFHQTWRKLPTSLTSIKVTEVDGIFLMPEETPVFPHLRQFRFPASQFTTGSMKMLPSSLTELETLVLTDKLAQKLPTGLKTVKICSFHVSSVISKLPENLEKMVIRFPLSFDVEYDDVTRTINTVSMLRKKYPDYSLQHVEDFGLPPKLKSITILGANELRDSFMKRAPRTLEQLKVTDSNLLSNACIDPLSSFNLLKRLELSSHNISGDCFNLLPLGLLELRLEKSHSIKDSHIALLPRSLELIYFRIAMQLTNQCLSTLPPGLKRLHLDHNHYLTPQDVPSFPPSMLKSRSGFCNAIFILNRGQVKLKRKVTA